MVRILLAEDQPADAELFSEAVKLCAPDTTIDHVMDGATAISSLRDARPDLLVLDLELPNKSGLEVLLRVRGDHNFVGMPVIVLTAHNDRDTVHAAWSAGCTAFIPKQTAFEDYCKAIEALMAWVTNPLIVSHLPA